MDPIQNGCTGECQTCLHCTKFHDGDRIQLSFAGIMKFGKYNFSRGTVCGQIFRKRTIIIVNWDGFPERMRARVEPCDIEPLTEVGF